MHYIKITLKTDEVLICSKSGKKSLTLSGPNTAQKWQQLLLLGAKSLVQKFDFF